MRKPILIVDGFDPGNNRRFEKHEKEDDDDADNLRCYSIWKLLEYEKGGAPVNFGRELLRDYGYDLVVLDLPDGGGYIERNAMVCIEVINEINRMLTASGSSHEIVVVGPSMGGQVTRYALTYMEQHPNDENCNYGKHNCRLWVSYDSPHQGANISIGSQELIKYFSILASIEEKWKNTLCCPAALQMLMHHADATGASFYSKWGHNRSSNNSATNGYPEKLRKIAIANGSLNNTSNGDANGLAFEAWLLHAAFLTPMFGLLPSSVQILIHNTKDAGEGQVLKVRFWYGFIPIGLKTVDFNNNTGKCSADACPGGSYNTFDQLRKPLEDFNCNVLTNEHTHCFMPFTSVLDISGNMNYCTDISNRNLVTEGLIPFESYAGSTDNNMYHVTFNETFVDYLTDEIETYIKPGKRTISFCEDTAHYTVNFPANASTTAVTWSCSSNLQILSGQGTKTIIVQALDAGAGWVKAAPTLLAHGNNHKKELKQYDITVTYPQSGTNAPAQITSNQTWTTPYGANGVVNIANGATLTIKSNLYCTSSAQITVAPGGKLVIDGGTLTNACPNTMWQGIVVNSTGQVEVTNNGKIENAVCGITVNSGGKVTTSTNAQFINNKAGVKLAQGALQSTFNNTSFVLNSSYLGNTSTFETHLN